MYLVKGYVSENECIRNVVIEMPEYNDVHFYVMYNAMHYICK